MAEVVTGEAVVLDLAVARFPNRILAEMIDIAVQLAAISFIEGAVFGAAGRHLNAASAAALWLVGYLLIIVAYPVTFETLSRGKTLGKLALGIRVVSDDGGPERFRQALVRALAGAFDAREKAVQAQEAAMGALNLPSAADLERLTRRVRSLSQRLEGIEDGVDRLDERLAALPGSGIEERLSGIEAALDKLGNEVEALRKKLPATPPKRAAAAKKAS